MTPAKAITTVGLATLAFVSQVGPAHPADLGNPDRMPSLWQGFYVGSAVGATGSGIDLKSVGPKNKFDLEDSAFSATAIVGYNFAHGPWVWGAEADFTGIGFNERQAISGLGTVSAGSDWAATVRLRGGYAFDRLLVYATAGLAFADLDIASSLGGKENSVKTGLALGLGAEYALDNRWSARFEALTTGFAEDDARLNGKDVDVSLGHSTLRAGVVHRF